MRGATRALPTKTIVLKTREEITLSGVETAKIIAHSLGWVCGLAWNAAFQSVFDKFEFLSVYGPWVYAFLVTIFSVGAIRCLRGWTTWG